MVQSLAHMVLQVLAMVLQQLHMADLSIPTHLKHHMVLQHTHMLPSQALMARLIHMLHMGPKQTHMLTLRNNMVSMVQILSAHHWQTPSALPNLLHPSTKMQSRQQQQQKIQGLRMW